MITIIMILYNKSGSQGFPLGSPSLSLTLWLKSLTLCDLRHHRADDFKQFRTDCRRSCTICWRPEQEVTEGRWIMNWCFFVEFHSIRCWNWKGVGFLKDCKSARTNQRVKSWLPQEFWDQIALVLDKLIYLDSSVGKPWMCSLVLEVFPLDKDT